MLARSLDIKTKSSGFTLVELMVVVLIGAILVGIAVPAYQSQVRKSRRTDAKTALLDLATREAKYMTLNNTYTPTNANLGYSGTTWPQLVGGNYYNVYVCPGTAAGTSANTGTGTPCIANSTTTTGTSFVVSAIAVTGTSQAKDTQCLYFAVDNTGTQFAANSTSGTGTDTTTTCWQ